MKSGKFKGKSLCTDIVKRFVKDWDGFMEDYKNAKLKSKLLSKPSQNDLRMAQALKESKSVGYVSSVFHVSAFKVYAAVARVEAWENK